MVLFDISMRDRDGDFSTVEGDNNEKYLTVFEPDITKLVVFDKSRRHLMRSKTKILIMQHYEAIKQKMLCSGGSDLRGDSGQTEYNLGEKKAEK